jgi:aspartate racemase
MKTLGVVGGIAPESTVEYYRLLIARYRAQKPDGSYPQIIINSIDLNKMLGMVAANETSLLIEYLTGEVRKLAQAGADFGLLASNTPHIVFDEVRQRSPIPLVSIVESACNVAKNSGFKRVGLFGTRFTMQGRFYPEVFSRAGINIVVPKAAEQDYIHDKYMNELVAAKFLDDTRAGLLEIANRLKKESQIEALILGGTELPLILRDSGETGIPFLDTTRIHVEAAIAQMLA